MFGGAAVMYELWHPSERPTSRPIILVGTKRQELEYDSEGKPLERWLHQLGPMRSHVILREDVPLRHVYYRIAQGYSGTAHPERGELRLLQICNGYDSLASESSVYSPSEEQAGLPSLPFTIKNDAIL
ncbi:MAG: hypothetical protein ABI270_10260 [Nitrosospira sp.]